MKKAKEGERMRIIETAAGTVFSVALILIAVITSFEFVVYGGDGYFRDKYEKYRVMEATGMEMDALLEVSSEMMDYLRGDRDNLEVMVTIDGRETGFFNQREKAHMQDVKNLFLGGLMLRRVAAAILLAAFFILFLMHRSFRKVFERLAGAYIAVSGAIIGLIGILAVIMYRDFTGAFTIFHELFFDNDLWLLDPATDRMINMLPEGFFIDTAAEIGVAAAGSLLFLFLASVVYLVISKRRRID